MIRKNSTLIRKIFAESRLLLLLNFCVLCFFCGHELDKYRSYGIGAFGYILGLLTNHYYVLYCLLPIMLLLITKHIKNISDIEIIRYRNAFCQIRQTTTKFLLWTAVYLFAHLIIISVIGLSKLPLSSDQKLIDLSLYDELIILLNEYINFFGNTLIAVIPVIGYMLFGFAVLVSLLSYINYRLGYKTMIWIAIAIYLLAFIGFKTDVKTLVPIICFNNYIMLHHALFVNDRLGFALILLCGVLTTSLCFGKRLGSKQLKVDAFIITKKATAITMAVPLVIVLLKSLSSLTASSFSAKNVLASVFLGTGEQSSSMISWLGLTILYMTPLFLIGVSDSRLKQYAQLPFITRFKNKWDFVRKVDGQYLKLLLMYILILAIIGNALLLIPPDTAGGSDDLAEVFGTEFSSKLLNLYLVAFSAYLLFDFILFRSLSRYIGSIATLILIFAGKFALFLLPDINYPMFNFGLINLYENIENERGLLLRTAALFGMLLLYFSRIYVKRWRYGNH